MTTATAPKSRTKLAYDVLRRDILNGTLPPDRKLMLSELQAHYDLGAMPLREALNRLAAEMLVEKHEQRGFTVPSINLDAYVEIQNARIAIEAIALRQSIAANVEGWEDELVLAFHHLKKAGPRPSGGQSDFLLTETWSETHGRFHRTLLAGCGNSWLMSAADKLYEQSSRYRMQRRYLSSLQLPMRKTLIQEHQAIMDAALAQDADLAVFRLVDHYRLSVEIVVGSPVTVSMDTLKLDVQSSGTASSDP